jgi:hypothetical protein
MEPFHNKIASLHNGIEYVAFWEVIPSVNSLYFIYVYIYIYFIYIVFPSVSMFQYVPHAYHICSSISSHISFQIYLEELSEITWIRGRCLATLMFHSVMR